MFVFLRSEDNIVGLYNLSLVLLIDPAEEGSSISWMNGTVSHVQETPAEIADLMEGDE